MSVILQPELFETIKTLNDLSADIPVDQWNTFMEKHQVKKFKKKELFMRAGDDPGKYGIVLDGVFRLYYVRDDGKEFTKIFRSKHGLVGAQAEIVLGIKSRIFIEAVVDSTLLIGDVEEFDKMCNHFHTWERVGRKFALGTYVEKEQREYELLQLSAMERYQNFQSQFSEIANQVPNYQIASYLGITPVALSRMLKETK